MWLQGESSGGEAATQPTRGGGRGQVGHTAYDRSLHTIAQYILLLTIHYIAHYIIAHYTLLLTIHSVSYYMPLSIATVQLCGCRVRAVEERLQRSLLGVVVGGRWDTSTCDRSIYTIAQYI